MSEATASGALEKGGCVRITEGEVRGDNQSNTSSPRRSGVPFKPQRVMEIEVPQNEEMSGGGKKGEKDSVLPSVGH